MCPTASICERFDTEVLYKQVRRVNNIIITMQIFKQFCELYRNCATEKLLRNMNDNLGILESEEVCYGGLKFLLKTFFIYQYKKLQYNATFYYNLITINTTRTIP